MKKFFLRAVTTLLLVTFVVEVFAPAVALAALPVAPGYKECPGGYQVKTNQDCGTTDWLFFGCMILTIGAATAAFWVASFGGINPVWGYAAMAAVFAAGATNCPRLPPPQPNLTASNVLLASGSEAKESNKVKFTGRIVNNGASAAGVSFANIFRYRWENTTSWTNLTSVSGGPVANGSSVVITSPELTLNRTGRLYVQVCADSGKGVAESDENDNCSNAGTYFTVTPATPVLNLALSITRAGALTAGTDQVFTGTVRNNGAAAAPNVTQRICIDNPNCLTTPTGILGTSLTTVSLGLNTPVTFPRTWSGSQVTADTHTAYFCVVGYSCATTQFVIQNSVTQCNYQGRRWSIGTTYPFYNTQTAYNGDCDTGTDSSGTQYRRDLQCGAGGIVTNNPGNTYSYTTCNEVTQNAVTITANGESGSASVKKGSSVTIAWNGGNATSCTVSALGTAGFSGSGVSGSRAVTINQKTIFTATCMLGSGTNSTQRSATVTVNLLPTEIEI